MQSDKMQSDTCFWQNGRMNPNFQFDRRARRRAMPIVGCGFARYNLNVRFWQNEPNRFLLECPCLDVPTWQTQWHFAPAAAPSLARCEPGALIGTSFKMRSNGFRVGSVSALARCGSSAGV